MADAVAAALSTPGAVWLGLAALIAGTVRGFSGFGTALVYLPVAGMFLPPFHAIATVIAMDLLGPLPNLRVAWRVADHRDLALLMLGVLLGLPIGLLALSCAAPEVFRAVVSIVALAVVAALALGYRLNRRPRSPGVFAIGAAGGALGGFAGIPGPPVILAYVAGPHSAMSIRANTMLYLYGFDVLALLMLAAADRLTAEMVLLGLLLGVPNMAGNLLGGMLFDPDRERLYRQTAYAVILCSALLGLPIFG